MDAIELARGTSGVCYAVQGDLTRDDDRQRLLDEIVEKEGKCHVLINNSGLMTISDHITLFLGTNYADSFQNYPSEAFRKVFEVNVSGPFLLTQKVKMIKTKKIPEKYLIIPLLFFHFII